VKIAQVSPYDVEHPGGVGKHIAHLKEEFEAMGHEVVVLAPRSESGGLEVRPGFYGIGRTFSIPTNGSKARLTFDITLYNAVKEILDREQFDVIHLHEALAPLLPHMVVANSKAVNVATFHAARASNPWYSAFKPYFSFLVGRLDGRIAVSESAREMVSQYFRGPYDIIPNGIDTVRYNPSVEPFEWAGDGVPRVLFVGRFGESRKGFRYLLRAMPMIQQQYPNARLVVVGPGESDALFRMVEQYDIRNVDYVGQVPGDDLPRYYRSCDVFCAPSIHGESFGMILLEGMATGTPVVASNISGYSSVVTHDVDGLLVNPNDSAAIALAVVRLLADASLRERLARHGIENSQQYAWPRIAARVMDVYERAAGPDRVKAWENSVPLAGEPQLVGDEFGVENSQ